MCLNKRLSEHAKNELDMDNTAMASEEGGNILLGKLESA